MNDRPSVSSQPGLLAGPARLVPFVLLGAVCALVIGVYAWSAKSVFVELQGSNDDNTYYNLLVEGFRSGQLNLKTEVPPELAQLADHSDSRASRSHRVDQNPLTDVSCYRGKLYLYFGVTPAVLLFWPYRELTGHHLFHKDAVVIFFSLGFLVSVGLLCTMWRRYFAEVRVGVVGACALALGLANFTLVCLPRGGVYEVAISCGYAMVMVAVALLWQALQAPRGRPWWLAGASLAYGLAVGARPSLLFGAVILLLPVVRAWRELADPDRRRPSCLLLLAAAVPILFVGLGLMLYNLLRFDNPFEFGEHYVLSWAGQRSFQPQYGLALFSPRYLWFNFQVYFLELARWSGRFPFVHDIASSPPPPGHAGVEHVFGVLTNLPLVWLAVALPLIWRRRWGVPRSVLRWFGVALVLLSGTSALTLSCFLTAYGRYQVEFLPALVWLAVLGILGLERAGPAWASWRRGIRWGWGLLLACALAFNLFAMIALASDLYAANGVLSIRKGQMDEAIVYFRKALALQPDNSRACSGLGVVLQQQGKMLAAAGYHEQALRFKPDYPEAHNNLGVVLFELGRLAEALGHYEQALRLKPDFIDAHYNLGVALSQQGRAGDAIGHLEHALRLEPVNAQAHFELGKLFLEQGRLSEAIGHLEQCLRLRPGDAEAHYHLGTALFQLGKVPEAIEHLELTLRLQPEHAEAHNNLGIVLFQQRDVPAAIEHLEQALRLKPDFANAHYNLGMALAHSGRMREAIAHFEPALRIEPDYPDARKQLAWILATCADATLRNGKRAVALAERVNQLAGGSDASVLETLAAAYAEAARFDDAVRTAQMALALVKAVAPTEQARRIESRLELYQARRPYHEPSPPGP